MSTKFRLPPLETAKALLASPQHEALGFVSHRLRAAMAIATADLNAEEISLKDLFRLARFIDESMELLPEGEEVGAELAPGVHALPDGKDGFVFVNPPCDNPDCELHAKDGKFDAEAVRSGLLQMIRKARNQLPSQVFEYLLRVLRNPGTTFEQHPAGILVNEGPTPGNDPKPNLN